MTKLTPKKQKKLLKKLGEILLNDNRKSKIIEHYASDDTYLLQIVKALKILLSAIPEDILDVRKETRSGYTTSATLAALFLKKKILIVEPTNEIIEKTVRAAVEIYVKITADDDLMVRPIPSNEQACEMVENDDPDIHMHQFSPKCEECSAKIYRPTAGQKDYPLFLDFDDYYCVVKTMMQEKEAYGEANLAYGPDILTITYAKMKYLIYGGYKNEFYNDLLTSREIILWDEFGKFLLSSSETAMITEVKYNDNKKVLSETNITEEIPAIIKFINENKSEINGRDNGSKSKDLLNLIYEYILPLVRYYNDLISLEKLPSTHTNPLIFESVVIKIKGVPTTVPKNEALAYKMPENMMTIQNIDINKQGKKYKIYLAALVHVLTGEDFVLKDEKTIDWDTEYFDFDTNEVKNPDDTDTDDKKGKHPTTKQKVITASNKGLLLMFAHFIAEHKETSSIITDATIPDISLDYMFLKLGMYCENKKHVPVNFGDPGRTNEKKLILHLKTKVFRKFNAKTFIENRGYAAHFYEIIDKILDEINIGNAFLIVTNKKVHDKILKYYKDIAVSSNDEEQPPDKLIITYFGSKMSRGVSCDRRICVSLGMAWKPLDAFKAIVLGQGNLYIYADGKLDEHAKNADLTPAIFGKMIEKYFYPGVVLKPSQLSQEKVPEKLLEWFTATYEALGADATAQDTCQGIDRAKDPGAEEQSVVIMIGVGDKDVKSLVTSVSQNDKVTKDFKITSCKVIQRSDLTDGKKWMDGEDIRGDIIGLDKDFTLTLREALENNHKKPIAQAEIEDNLLRNMNLHNRKPDYHNGYLVGIAKIRRKQMEGVGIEIKKSGNQHIMNYTFYLKEGFKEDIDLKLVELTPLEENALTILEKAYITIQSKYSLKIAWDNNLVMAKVEFINAMDYIHDNEILKGSSWTIEINERNNKVIYKDAPNRS